MEFVVKINMIGRDLMQGNPRLAELGFEEEAVGHHVQQLASKSQRQWTDHFPNGTLWKLSSILSLTGMVFENHLYLLSRE